MPFPLPDIWSSILIFISFAASHLFSRPCTSTEGSTLTGGHKRHLCPHDSHVFDQVKRTILLSISFLRLIFFMYHKAILNYILIKGKTPLGIEMY